VDGKTLIGPVKPKLRRVSLSAENEMRIFRIALYCLVCGFLWQASAQTSIPWDSSGNGLLQGNYYFRQVAYSSLDTNGNIGDATSVYGAINFDGKGKYTITGQIMDSSTTKPKSYNVSGTYTIAASGLGFMDSPLVDGEFLSGLVSQGVFVGSSTESQTVNDLLVAVPAGPAQVTNATLSGNYWVASTDFPSGDPAQVRDAFFQMNADGNGNLTASLVANGYIGTSGSTGVKQTIQGAHYAVSNGMATVTFPIGSTAAAQSLISGDKVTYVSPDGNFFVGGSATGYDFIVGIRAATGTVSNSAFKGLYYIAGLYEDDSQISTSYGELSTYYGSLSANGAGVIIEHQRLAPFDYSTYDYTLSDVYALKTDGSYDDTYQQYALGAGGIGFVGIADGPGLGVFIGVKGPSLTGGGVYLNPAGIVNAASYAPFTAGISRGELITLYGTNLAPSTMVAQAPFPTSLNGVQVMMNNRPAPIYYVSAGQLSVVVPYGTENPSNVQIQVINNGNTSNTVTTVMNLTSPGVFTSTQNGTGTGAALHSDFSLVTKASPAKRGETISLFVTGLGDVKPAVSDGAVGPSNPLSTTTETISVYIAGTQATVSYAGLAPGLSGLYQINVLVPAFVTPGDVYLDVEGPDSYTTEATIPVQ
jgi:uncharacterized protein (TIGR03437 family)